MASRALIVFSLCFITVLQLAGAGSAPDKLNGLLDNSPFGVSRANAAAGSSASDPFEFRSVYEEKGSKFFSIYDTATHRSAWVELNDPVNGFTIKSYDAGHENVTVDYHNKTMTLSIKRAPAVAQAAPSMTTGTPPGNSSAQGAPSPTDPQRLQQIQEEIRRRRALRQPSLVPSPSSGAQSGPQLMPILPGSQSGPQPVPTNLPGPQFVLPANSSGPQPMPAKP